MRKLVFSCVAATLLAATPAAANPCMSDLFSETYATEGQCQAAIAQKRNEIRRFLELRGGREGFGAPELNEWVRMSFDCAETNEGWAVVYVG